MIIPGIAESVSRIIPPVFSITSATAFSYTSIVLEFSLSSTGGSPVTAREARYRTTSGPGAWSSWVTTDTTGYSFMSGTSNTSYDFEVRFTNAAGSSVKSVTASTKTKVDLTVSRIDSGNISADTYTEGYGPLIRVQTSPAISGVTLTARCGDTGDSANGTSNGSGYADIRVNVNNYGPLAPGDVDYLSGEGTATDTSLYDFQFSNNVYWYIYGT